MQTIHWAIQMGLWLALGLLGLGPQQAWAAEGNIEYRFERMVPKLEQPWYFHAPWDIAIAPDGSVWVADTYNDRIQHFKTDGTFIGSFGSKGSAPGQFRTPTSIGIAADGSVWVVDEFNNRIQHFQANGTFIKTSGSYGSAAGQFSGSAGIDVAADGSVWVADAINHRIQHFKDDGTFISAFGSEGHAPGQFSGLSGLSVALDGSLWVTDEFNNRIIQHFMADGTFIEAFGSVGSDPGQFKAPKDIDVAADGSLWVADWGNHRIQHLNADGTPIGVFGNFGSADGQFYSPIGIGVAADGSVWVADTGNDRIQHLNADGTPIAVFSSEGTTAERFNDPSGIKAAGDGSLWVADQGNNRIQHLNADGTFIAAFRSEGSALGQFSSLNGIGVAGDNSVWVTEGDVWGLGNQRIQHFKADGTFIGTFGSKGSAPGQFMVPSDIGVADDGSVWVADTWNHRIQHLQADGTFIKAFGSKGSAPSQFNLPKGIGVAADGSVWVADTFNHRIQHFKADGTFIKEFGTEGSAAGQFSLPGGIGIAVDGSVWVADWGNNRIQHLQADGTFIEALGGFGSAPGQFNYPDGIGISPDGSVLVADSINNRLQKFGPSKGTFKAIILAGGGEYNRNIPSDLWSGTWRVAKKAFNALSRQGFKVHDEIAFLTAGSTQIDIDNNGKYDDLEVASEDNLRRKITEWAADAQDVVIYLVDHGGPGKFQLNGSEILKSEELNAWVTQLEQAIPGKVTIVIDACNSAGFFNALANKTRSRYVFASTKADQLAVLSNDGLSSFSYFFWSEVIGGTKLQNAFRTAKQAMISNTIDMQPIEAQMDADGDAMYTENDLPTLGDYCLGQCTKTAALLPTIEPISPSSFMLTGATRQSFTINVKHLQPLLEAWLLVQRPDDITINPEKPLNFEKIPLSCNAQDQCSANYDRFDTLGEYRLSAYVMDTLYAVSSPETVVVTQTKGKSVPPVEYDDKQTTIYLRDIKVGDTHYQAALQEQNGQYVLLPGSAKAAPTLFNPAAVYDAGSNTVSIPWARAFGQDYQATLKHLGNFVFELQQAGPK